MTNVGSPDNFIDTQGVVLENITDSLIYDQSLSIVPAEITHSMDFNQLTNDTVEKLFGLTDAAFEVEMMVTQPELSDLIALSLQINAKLATRFWSVSITSVSGNTTVIDGTAAISKLSIVDPGVGFATIELTLDFVTTATISSSGDSTIP